MAERKNKNKVETISETDSWIPKTELGKKVKNAEITNIDEIFNKGYVIREPEIIDKLMPNLEHDLILIGQAKGKFGGGQRRAFKQTQKKTAEGNKPKFSVMVVVGNRNGYVGVGMAGSHETFPAREKALKKAKLNLIRIKRGCGSWECNCGETHSIPFKVSGRCSSVRIDLLPAPKGVGLVVHDEAKKILELAGIKDVWSRTKGQTNSRINLTIATMRALKKLTKTKYHKKFAKQAGIIEGGKEE